jgi:sulfatase maturation enzyme AslB (radical SAM superfamily)
MKPLCYAPFIGLYATGYADYAPCCVSEKLQLDMTAEQYWTSEEMKQLRSELTEGVWPTSCAYCERKKSKGLRADVDFWNTFYEQDDVEIDIVSGNTTGAPLYLDYRPSNVCNLKCRMCVPNASSQIEQEINLNPHLGMWRKAHNRSLKYTSELSEYLSSVKLKQIKILGGEPTLDENVITLLENLIAQHGDDLPELRFTTNGTNLNARFRRIMEKFIDIHVCYSVDAANSTYEYIRTNANWDKTRKQIEENFNSRLARANKRGFNTVVMPYNQFALTELLDWFYSLYARGHTDFYVNFDDSDIYYTSMSAILPDDMTAFIKRTQDWIDRADPAFVQRIDGVGRLMDLLHSVDYNEKHYLAFVQYNRELDAVRNTQLIDLDPRFERYT